MCWKYKACHFNLVLKLWNKIFYTISISANIKFKWLPKIHCICNRYRSPVLQRVPKTWLEDYFLHFRRNKVSSMETICYCILKYFWNRTVHSFCTVPSTRVERTVHTFCTVPSNRVERTLTYCTHFLYSPVQQSWTYCTHFLYSPVQQSWTDFNSIVSTFLLQWYPSSLAKLTWCEN